MEKKLVSFVASALLVSSAMAAPNIATDGTGDYLVAPMYTFGNGYETKLVLMNTDNEHSYLVRGVVRSYRNSTEIKDFTIMLSPGDVWDATISNNKIVSNDDSNWKLPLDEDLHNIADGYVEFFVLAELNNDNPAVQLWLQKSNYSDIYKTSTTDVYAIDKLHLKSFFTSALNGESDFVLDHTQINNDAIGGYVTISSVKNDTLHSTIPLFAFEHTREGGANLDAYGMHPGERSDIEPYVGSNRTDILNLIRYKYVSIPYDLENGDAKINFTFILDHYGEGIEDLDDRPIRLVQTRTYKQNFRNMAEKYPKEISGCLEGQDLIDYVVQTFPDAQDPKISPFYEPQCTPFNGWTLYFSNEFDGIIVSDALDFEANKKQLKRTIKYFTKDLKWKEVNETIRWNDVNRDDYIKGMFQIHNILNVYDNKDLISYNDGQTQYGNTLEAGYIPTYFDIKTIDGKIFLNWNYAIRTK